MTGLIIDKSDYDGDWVSLSVSGEIDLATVDQLERDLKDCHESGSGNLAVDLTGADFMDSSGLRCLVMADRAYRESGRRFALVVHNGPISRLIELSGIEATSEVVSSYEELVS
ncbi:anti-sigma factor antagonist [soil metagenome]